MDAAQKLRMTSLPTQLLAGQRDRLAAMIEMDRRQKASEGELRKMNRAVRYKMVAIRKSRETIKNPRERESELRNTIRNHGLLCPLATQLELDILQT